MPSLLFNYVKPTGVVVLSETGGLGLCGYPTKSDVDPDRISGYNETVSELPGSSFFGTDESFDMIRG